MGVSRYLLVSSFFFRPDFTFSGLAIPSSPKYGSYCFQLIIQVIIKMQSHKIKIQLKRIKWQAKEKEMEIIKKWLQKNDQDEKIIIEYIISRQLIQHGNKSNLLFKMQSTNPLSAFRSKMKQKDIDAYVLPRTDEHQSQYLCPCDERVAFLSGFTGSNAIALISQTQALLWTDGRYFLQAEKQLLQGWQLRKMIEGEKKWFQHLSENYQNQKVQIDGRLISASTAKERKTMLESKGLTVNFVQTNLVDEIWTNRPSSSATHIFVHENWAGKSLSEKVNWIRNHIKQKGGDAALFTQLGEIAWILNLRSGQIPYNPFFKSILLININGGTLYLPSGHPSLKNQEVIGHLGKQNIELKTYNPEYPNKVLCLPNQLNYSIHSSLKEPISWDGIGLFRVVRTQKQLNGFRRCHVADGVAMAKFWSWRSKLDSIGEYEAAKYLDNLRKQQKDNRGLSFVTISGGGPNGAIIHYHPSKKVSSLVTKDMVHLVDSGGQYLDGTTDVTRAFHFGNPTPEQKDSFTRVLLGNLDIQRMRWPQNVKMTGAQLDVLARRHLWSKGLDFQHGTGHGVGYFGGVHEGPIGISKYNKVVFEPNMIVTNEPGYYEPGKYGIRIENMLIVVKDQKGLLTFENLTLCPYDKNLFDFNQLSSADKAFINCYHERVFNVLSPHLQGDTETIAWLKQATSPI